MSSHETFKFTPPPECPVFEPTAEEFEDAFKYIAKIKCVGEKYGLCKIKPPSTWKPPFMVDHSTFKFTPRIQKLNEIEATSRVRLMFLINLSKFWQLQGFDLKTPTVSGKHLDFFRLKKVVESESGFENVCTKKLWSKIAASLHLHGSKAPYLLRQHYEKVLYPYDIFLAGIHNRDQVKVKKEVKVGKNSKKKNLNKSNKKSLKKHVDDDDEYICRVCGRGDNDEVLLLCDGCDDACHTFCLIPPLSTVPKGDWRCPSCVAQECSKPSEAYGFEQSEKEYTLSSFTDMANEFKEKYFCADPQSVPCKKVEEEFWRILSSAVDVVVQYGADNPAGTCGSGFPTLKNHNSGDEMYVHSSWNLNNLSVLPSSVLRFIEDEVSGMKVPWCYVGMAFSCFSWHTEDHWSYSVNYMHWGQPKTWYGVPGCAAEKLQQCMLQNVPELFQHSPDLMHQLTTLLNPNLLMSFGVPITRIDQHAGEFIITFPRAYHAGFNQGINFAEAVNYCPPDWIEFGRKSVIDYKTVHRQCVFSLDELFCAVSRHHESLDVDLVEILHEDLEAVFHCEREAVKMLMDQGVRERRQEIFEKLSDDERQCCVCCTTCFLFSLICSCSHSRGLMSCLEHSRQLCKCPLQNKIILYRFEDQELGMISASLKRRKDKWNEWKNETNEIVAGVRNKNGKPELSVVKDLIIKCRRENFPRNDGLVFLLDVAKTADVFLNRFRQCVVVSAVKTRNKQSTLKFPKVCDLEGLLNDMETLDCKISHEHSLTTSLLEEAKSFKSQVEMLDSMDPPSGSLVEELLEQASNMSVDMEEISIVEKISYELDWCGKASNHLESTEKSTIMQFESLVESAEKLLSAHKWFHQKLSEVQHVVKTCYDLKERSTSLVSMVTAALVDRSKEVCLEDLEKLVDDSRTSKVYLEDVEKIKNICSKVHEWKDKMQSFLDRHHKIHLEELEEVLGKAELLPVNLKLLDKLQMMWQEGCEWRNNLKDLITRVKQTSHSLITKLFRRAPAGVTFDVSLKFCDLSSHFCKCEVECSSAIENIRRYSERYHTASQQLFSCQACHQQLGNKFHRCPVCRAPLHERCLVDHYTSSLTSSGCPSCQSDGGSVGLKLLVRLVGEYRRLNICLWDGEVLCLLVERALSWQGSVVSELNVCELKQFCLLLVSKNRLLSRSHMPFFTEIEQSSLSSSFSLLPIKFPKATLERLISLLLCGHMMDVDLDLCNILSCLVHACQIPSIRNVNGTPTLSNEIAGKEASRCTLRDSCKVIKKSSKAARPCISKSEESRRVKRKLSSEECSFKPCKKPKGRKVDWVQCDKCDLWYHLACLGLTLENLTHDLEYLCPPCSSGADPLTSDSLSVSSF